MEKPIIQVKNIGKKYNINHQKGGYVTLRDKITNVFINPFSFLKNKIKQVVGIGTQEEFWALKDINFEIKKGEVVGIVGQNGAGKSTLLKILSQITPPTTGEIKIHGTVGSLLEVGTGFHPELTGRENIFLNGAILGIKKKDIINKFEKIVEFAGIEKFLDTPVKYYSSGMYVRLAFSVAAHMETDILIIDEVLAVGDAEFQKKCLGKMEDITKKQGRTILFVSHNMEAVKKICEKVIWLENGSIKNIDKTETIITEYLQKNNEGVSEKWINKNNTKENIFFQPEIFEIIRKENDVYVQIEANIKELNKELTIGYALYTENMELLYWSYQTDDDNKIELKLGKNIFQSKLPLEILNNGKYIIELIGGIHGKKWFFEPNKGNPTLIVDINKEFNNKPFWIEQRPGILAPKISWKN